MKKAYLLLILMFILSSCGHVGKVTIQKEPEKQEICCRYYFPLVIQDYNLDGDE